MCYRSGHGIHRSTQVRLPRRGVRRNPLLDPGILHGTAISANGETLCGIEGSSEHANVRRASGVGHLDLYRPTLGSASRRNFFTPAGVTARCLVASKQKRSKKLGPGVEMEKVSEMEKASDSVSAPRQPFRARRLVTRFRQRSFPDPPRRREEMLSAGLREFWPPCRSVRRSESPNPRG